MLRIDTSRYLVMPQHMKVEDMQVEDMWAEHMQAKDAQEGQALSVLCLHQDEQHLKIMLSVSRSPKATHCAHRCAVLGILYSPA
jgi:hypothetical protein